MALAEREILIPNIADFEQRWNKAVAALESSIKVLRHPQEFGAISSEYLPYVSILPVFAALQSHLKTLPAQKPTRRSEKNPTLVLGFRLQQSLFWLGGIDKRERFSRPQGMD